jgi:hypothetical protein
MALTRKWLCFKKVLGDSLLIDEAGEQKRNKSGSSRALQL